eukprot:2454-Hanusia_phi.AAC.2
MSLNVAKPSAFLQKFQSKISVVAKDGSHAKVSILHASFPVCFLLSSLTDKLLCRHHSRGCDASAACACCCVCSVHRSYTIGLDW